MKNACPACGAMLSYVRNASPRFDCPGCGAALRSNAPALMLAAVGITFMVALPAFALWGNDTLGGFYVTLLAELAIALAVYALLARRYYRATLDEDSG